jgi:hypothetical protein
MFITQNMQSYIQDLKSLSEIPSFEYFNKTDEEFEKIYQKAQNENVDLSNAKEILESLSKTELMKIQQYKSLADPIKVDTLSEEGAYNLLVHNYENIDYNGDGYVEVGIGKSVNMIPQEAPHEFRQKFIATLKEMKKNGANDFEIMSATIATFGTYTLTKTEKNRYDEDPSFRALLKEHGIDKFVLQTPSFDDDYILKLKYELEHPKAGEYASPEFIEGMRKFFTAYETVSKDFNKDTTPSLEKIAFDYKQAR